MRWPTALSPGLLLAALCLCPVLRAQLPGSAPPCTAAKSQNNNPVVAAQAAQGSNHKAIIDSVTFDRPVDALPAVVDEVIEQAKQLEFDGDSGWLNQFAEATIRDTWQKHGYFRASAAQLVQTLSAHVDEQRRFGPTKGNFARRRPNSSGMCTCTNKGGGGWVPFSCRPAPSSG